jgi:Pentapeptide repeats (8 copies)
LHSGGYLFTRSENNRTLEIANKQREVDREIAEQRGQDDALQAYLDQIGQLLLDEERSLRESKVGDEERTFARARTKEVLWKLSPHRKRNVLQFLYEACLIKRDNKVIDLSGADLRNAYLWKLDLKNADLTGTDIKGANLSEAKLSGADLRGSMLGRADLREANLVGVDLSNAKEWTEDQLIAAHLEGATMPNGHTYEDWLKDKEGRGEDMENSGPS